MDEFKFFRGIEVNTCWLSEAEKMFDDGLLSANLKFNGEKSKVYYLPRFLNAKRPVLFIAPQKYRAYERNHPFSPFGDNLVNGRFDPENRFWRKLVFLIEDNISLPGDQNLRNVYFGKAELQTGPRSGSFWTFEFAEPSQATHVLFETYHSPHPVSIPFRKSDDLLEFGDFYDDTKHIGSYIITSINVSPQCVRDRHGLITSIATGLPLDYVAMYKETVVLSYYLRIARDNLEAKKKGITSELIEERTTAIRGCYSEEVCNHIFFGHYSVSLSFGGSNLEVLYNDDEFQKKIDRFAKKVTEHYARERMLTERETTLRSTIETWFGSHKTILYLLKRHGFDGCSVSINRSDNNMVTVSLDGLMKIGSNTKWTQVLEANHFAEAFDSWIRDEVASRYRNLEYLENYVRIHDKPTTPKKKSVHKQTANTVA